jgi:hypothetical protein
LGPTHRANVREIPALPTINIAEQPRELAASEIAGVTFAARAQIGIERAVPKQRE